MNLSWVLILHLVDLHIHAGGHLLLEEFLPMHGCGIGEVVPELLSNPQAPVTSPSFTIPLVGLLEVWSWV